MKYFIDMGRYDIYLGLKKSILKEKKIWYVTDYLFFY